jgi:RNA polymerase sigma-70 factor, ECF subfamily
VTNLPRISSDPDLVGRAVGGDSLALQQLLVRHFAALERHVAARIPVELGAAFAAEDVLQDTFSQTFRDIASFKGDGDLEFFAWLRTIAEHRLADAVKALRRQKRGGDFRRADNQSSVESALQLVEVLAHESRTPLRSAARREAAQAIQVHVAALPEDQRDVIRSKYFLGHDVGEIARQMGRTPGAIRGLLHRAQQRLAELLGSSSRWLDS